MRFPAPWMVFAAILVITALSINACAPEPQKVAQAPRKIPPASVSSTIELPGGDGRVHIVTVPSRLDAYQCAVLITSKADSISCLQAGEPTFEFEPKNAPPEPPSP
jgi:hypothetical protein